MWKARCGDIKHIRLNTDQTGRRAGRGGGIRSGIKGARIKVDETGSFSAFEGAVV